MEGIPLTRAYLNSLTNTELFGMAENLGIDTSQDTPNELDRFSLIEEMLEIASPNAKQTEPEDLISMESVPLPKQYNITFIEVMIRDPFWAFIFWEIKSSDKEQFEQAHDFNGYYLKVSPLHNQADDTQAEGLFTVPVKPDDTARYLGLTPVTAGKTFWTGDRQYKVEFCVSLGGNESVLAVSNPVRLPGLPEFSAGADKLNPGHSGNQLISLSGYEDFRILRKNERLHRIKNYE